MSAFDDTDTSTVLAVPNRVEPSTVAVTDTTVDPAPSDTVLRPVDRLMWVGFASSSFTLTGTLGIGGVDVV